MNRPMRSSSMTAAYQALAVSDLHSVMVASIQARHRSRMSTGDSSACRTIGSLKRTLTAAPYGIGNMLRRNTRHEPSIAVGMMAVSYTHLRAHETVLDLV